MHEANVGDVLEWDPFTDSGTGEDIVFMRKLK